MQIVREMWKEVDELSRLETQKTKNRWERAYGEYMVSVCLCVPNVCLFSCVHALGDG
jgi:hypothetical protein